MESSGEYNRAAGLATAVVVSLVVHVVIVGVLAGFGRSSSRPAEPSPALEQIPAVMPPSAPLAPPEDSTTPVKATSVRPGAPAHSVVPMQTKPLPQTPKEVVPSVSATPKAVTEAGPTSAEANLREAEALSQVKEYVVKKGDNLTLIARRSGCSLEELAKLNNTTVKKLSNLWVGQKIKVK